MSCNGFARPDPLEVLFHESAVGRELDAFQRVRVSEPVTLFDHSNQYDTTPLLWETKLNVAGNVVHAPNQSAVTLSTAGNAADYAIRQTRAYHRYQPGKSQMVRLTRLFGAGVDPDGVQRAGLFDDDNGLFLQQSRSVGVTTLSFVVRSKTSGAVVDTVITQANWNHDKLDGTGPSGITLDMTKVQHIVIAFEWLGVGGVLFGFDFGNNTVIAHHFQSPNSLTVPYMTTANLPLRNEVRNVTGGGTGGTMVAICNTVISEGGFETERGYPFSVNNGAGAAIAVTTRRAILSIRPKATFNAIVNRGTIGPLHAEIFAQTNPSLYEIVYDPTFTVAAGALTWTSADASSIVEYSVHGDANAGAITAGITVQSGYVPISGIGATQRALAERDLISKMPLVLDIAGANPKALSIVCTSLNLTSDCRGAIGWQEYR